MADKAQELAALRPAGYAAIVERYALDVIPNWHTSLVATTGIHRTDSTGGVVEEVFPVKYWPGDTLGDHLEFALKYDGTNLAILASLFEVMATEELLTYVQSRPTGKYARRLWFLYEFLTGKRLPLDNAGQIHYIDLLDPDKYYTVAPAARFAASESTTTCWATGDSARRFAARKPCASFEQADLPRRCREVVSRLSPELLRRAMSYLYTKETKSSFEIERISPNPTRIERFIALLRTAEGEDFCEKTRLIELQNRIVDPRFRAADYRTSQNYVGETVAWQREKIHYACPKPEDLASLMEGLVAAHRQMEKGDVSAVGHAAAVAYGFVFLHPFEDGNGRIHRFLIHNILARRGFTPEGVMFPVSAAMLKDLAAYDASLEAFSRPLMPLVEYSLDEEGHMTVASHTARWYRYIDMTPQAESLFQFIERTIDRELVEELAFLANYDRTKKAIQEIVDMPDRQIDLFIRVCLQNNGRLSARKLRQFVRLPLGRGDCPHGGGGRICVWQ